MKKSIIFLMILLMPLVLAVEPEFIFEKDSTPNLLMTCNDGVTETLCSSNYNCTVNINYPNGTVLVDNSSMNRVGEGTYSFGLQNLSSLGFYLYNSQCSNVSDTGTSPDLFFRVTESGQVFSEAQGLGSLGIIISIIALSFFFTIMGFRFTQNKGTMPLALLFIVIGIFLVLYSLVLGLNYSVDILEYDGLSSLQSTIFVSVLYLVAGIGIISFILMAFSFVKHFGKGKMMKNFGEGFDPISETYN